MDTKFKPKFSSIIGFTTLIISSCAAGFSIYGIGNLFSGAIISTMIMATSLELGKFVATSFLYRYWDKINRFIKIYLTIAVLTLMIITSAGIFGFLSSAYQKSSLEFKMTQEKITMVESSKIYVKNQIETSTVRIKTLNDVRQLQENRLSSGLTNVFLSRTPIQLQQLQQQTIQLIDQSNSDINTENEKLDLYRKNLIDIDTNVNLLKTSVFNKNDIQTFKFLSESLHTDLDTVVKWFILFLIFVFDPLAIALILAYNISISHVLEKKSELTTIVPVNVVDPIVPTITENVTVKPVITQQTADSFFKGMFKQ